VSQAPADVAPSAGLPRPPAAGLARVRGLVRPKWLLVAAVVAVLLYLVAWPLAIVLITSIRTQNALPFDVGTTWEFGNYLDVFREPGFGRLIVDTLAVTALSMTIAFAVSIGLAWLIERTDMPLRNLAFVLVVSGLGIPGFVGGIAWVILANPSNGLLNELLHQVGIGGASGPLNVYSLGGFVFVQGILFVPATFLLVAAAFRGMDSRLEEAAGVSGAGTFTTLRRVTIPLLAPALVGALIYMFVTVVESFDVPLTIGLRAGITTLSSRVYLDLNPTVGFPNYAVASVHGVLLLVLGMAPLLYYNRLISRAEQFATISGRGVQRAHTALGRWRWVAFGAVVLYLVLALVLPMLVMIWTSLEPFYALPSADSISRISLNGFRNALSGGLFAEALRNTLILVLASGALAMAIGLVVSWIVVRARARAKVLLDILAFLPHVFPAPVLALSLLLIYISSSLPIYGTIWILVIALTTRYLGLSTRLMNGGVASLHLELEEAAAVSGASWWQTMRRVVLPLVAPSFANGFVMVALLGIQQLAMPLILASSSNGVLATLVWGRWTSGDTAPATALAVIMLAITMTIVALGRRFATPRSG
jgi:iron(III) transport system permease protein